MQPSDEIRQLLIEIRDAQREHLAEYKRVTQRTLELQEEAVSRQAHFGRLYQRVLIVAAFLLVCVGVFLVYHLGGFG
jgi:hypothetical protein